MIPLNLIPTSWKIGAAAFAVAALVSAGLGYHHRVYEQGDTAGFQRRDKQAKIDEAAIESQVAARYSKDLADARAETARLQAAADADAVTHQLDKDRHETDIKKHVAAALAGTERLRIATSAAPGCPVRSEAQAAGATAGTGASGETGSDLLPGTAAAIFRIAGDSRQLVLDYNTVVDRYDKIRASCNAE